MKTKVALLLMVVIVVLALAWIPAGAGCGKACVFPTPTACGGSSQGATPLSAEEKRTIVEWIDMGAHK